MWASTASGRGFRRSSAASWRTKRTPRESLFGAPKVRTRTLAGSSCRPTRAQSTATSSKRSARAADEVERLCEDGMVGVECLGDEDESQLGSRPAAIVRSASRRRERANSSGV